MLAFLLVVLAGAPLPGPAKAPARGAAAVRIPEDGWVVTPHGVRFQLPPRLAYSMHEKDGRQIHAAKSSDDRTLVAVGVSVAGSELPCDAAQEGVEVEAFETGRGLRACRVSAEADGEPLAIVATYVKGGDIIVTVNVIAPPESAYRLASSVVESVQIEAARGSASSGLTRLNLLKADPAMLGCFEQSLGYTNGYVKGFARAGWKRCFHEDLSFTEEFTAVSSMEHKNFHGEVEAISGVAGRRGPTRGFWSLEDGVLSLVYEDGSEAEWEVAFGETSILADGKLWERL